MPKRIKRITATQRLYRVLLETCDDYPSLNCLATWADMPFATAWHALRRLERDNKVCVHNRGGNGYALHIEILSEHEALKPQ